MLVHITILCFVYHAQLSSRGNGFSCTLHTHENVEMHLTIFHKTQKFELGFLGPAQSDETKMQAADYNFPVRYTLIILHKFAAHKYCFCRVCATIAHRRLPHIWMCVCVCVRLCGVARM